MEHRQAIELIKRVRSGDTCPPGWETLEAFDMAISALEKQEQDRWIPVTERLPDEDCACRVTEGDFKSVLDCCWNNGKKQFEVWSAYEDDYVLVANVTAWKPIEKPYTEEES